VQAQLGSGRRIVIIGAGKIGCGHVAALFSEAGWDIVLAARSAEVVERISAAQDYTVRVTDGGTQVITAAAVMIGSDEFDEAVAGADLIAMSVGARNVSALGGPVARALATRPSDQPVDVWAVENGDAGPPLEAAVLAAAAELGTKLPAVGFPGAISWRAVTSGDWKTSARPEFISDPTRTLVVDAGRAVSEIPDIDGIVASSDYAGELMGKFLSFGAGHAMCAYLGILRGHSYIHDAIADPLLRPLIQRSLQTSRRSLLSVEAASGADIVSKIEWIITRYGDAGLDDPLTRVARDPIRKLSPDGVLVGAAHLVHRVTGRVPAGFARAIASALAYRNDDDAQARQLREMLDRDGLATVLKEVCGLEDETDPLTREVTRMYGLIEASRRDETLVDGGSPEVPV
jgi:mannitol-1-phosphate 5-dehydrogenase